MAQWVPIIQTHIMQALPVVLLSKCSLMMPPIEDAIFMCWTMCCICSDGPVVLSGVPPGGPQFCPQGWGSTYQQWQAPGPQDPSK